MQNVQKSETRSGDGEVGTDGSQDQRTLGENAGVSGTSIKCPLLAILKSVSNSTAVG